MKRETRGRKAKDPEDVKNKMVAVRLDKAQVEKLDRLLEAGRASSGWRELSRAAVLRKLLDAAPEVER